MMDHVPVMVIIVLGLFRDCNAESCKEDKECLGYVRFSGHRCINNICSCDKNIACSNYEDVAKAENNYWCKEKSDCAAYNEYSGVYCLNGSCGCLKHSGCGACIPAIEVSGMVQNLNELCLYDSDGTAPYWGVFIKTDPGDKCYDLNLKVDETSWKVYSITYTNNFEILEENLVSSQQVKTYWANLPNPVNGLYALKVGALVSSDFGFNRSYELMGYFSIGCSNANFNPADPECLKLLQELVYIDENDVIYYDQLSNCVYGAAHHLDEPVQAMQGCKVTISCPLGCDTYLNRQAFTEFAVDVGCPFTIKLLKLVVRYCPQNDYHLCTYSDTVVDESTLDSVKYKPKPEHYSWSYHGLFLKVFLTTTNYISGVQLVEYGPVPNLGSCTILPATGYALTTLYNLTCTGFSVTENLKLNYRIFTSHEAVQETASLIYQGDSPDRPDMLLQQGKAATNYTVYIWVKASVLYGSYVQTMAQTQVCPPKTNDGSGGSDVVNLAESFLTVDENKNSSIVQDLISKGETKAATNLLGVITSSLNLEVTETKTSTVNILKKAQVRADIVTVLKEIPVTNIEVVSSTLSVLNGATEVKEEISEETKDAATDLYSSLADNFDNFVQESTEDVRNIAGSLLDGVTRMLDRNIDLAFNIEQVKLLAQTEVGAPAGEQSSVAVQNVEAVAKMKNSTVKLLNTLSKISNTLVDSQLTGANCSLYRTNTMTVGVQKLLKKRLSVNNYAATGNLNSSGSVKFQEIGDDELQKEELGVKMLYMDKNPYVWAAAKDITSPVMSISLSSNNTPVEVHDLKNPVTVALSSSSVPESKNVTFWAFIMEDSKDLQDQGAGNLTFDETRSSMMSFSIAAVSSRTIRISVTPLGNITNFKILIKTDKKPTLDEIINNGFLYPEEIPRSLFANFSFTQDYVPITDEEKRSLYVTPVNSISTNNYTSDISSHFSRTYYIGLTLDLTHNETLLQLQQSYTSCLGSEQAGCKKVVEVPLTIQTSQLGCFYWDEDRDVWSSEGCEVSPYSTSKTIKCHCTHLTAFSGSILVMPNLVDPLDVGLFLTVFDNPVVVTAVIIVWVIYFFLIHWARQADKKDLEKVGVISCLDNDPSYNYIYLVCAVTGLWKHAGTTANVFIFLNGTKGRSSTHCLTSARRLCFQPGSEDWFVITTEQSLGNLQSVTMWHDNMGASPQWYLNHVYVKDLQLRKSWHFIYNDWLAVDRGHMLQTSATMEAVTEEEIRFKQKHNFMMKSTRDLSDGHLWLSIFYKPARSTFTRVQRLTCALSFLLMTMLINLMFYGIPTDEPEDQAVMAGDISISLSAIIIGIESSLIMFPINLIILQLFLKVKAKPLKRTVKSFLKEDIHVQKMYDVSRRLTDVVMRNILQRILDNGNTSDQGSLGKNNSADLSQKKRLSFMAKESLSSGSQSRASAFSVEATSLGEKSDSEKAPTTDPLPKPRSPRVLPWWFIYIAWLLVTATSLVSSYFVMLYGLKYGYNKSVNWLVSFLTGFTQSAFVTQPLKVIVIAIIVTVIFKKPAEFDDFGPDAELDEDEVYLHKVEGPGEMRHPTVEPLSKYLLSKLRERLYLEWLMDIKIRDIVLYVIYTAVVIFMVHGNQNITLSYQNTAALKKLLLRTYCLEGENCFSLADAKTVEGMFAYIEKVLVPLLRDMSVVDHDNLTLGTNHYLLGPFRLRQQRIKAGTCNNLKTTTFKKFGYDLPECVSYYSFDNEDVGSYVNSWKIPVSGTSSGTGPWSYQSSWKLKTGSYTADHATYSGGGFVLEVPLNGTEVTLMNELRNTDWIDDRTRAVFIEFTLYNPNVDLISVVIILFEYTNVGGIFPEHQVHTTKLEPHNSTMGSYIAVCEFVFLLFNIAFIYIEVKRYRKVGRREYFKDKWSIVEILQITTACTVIGLFFQRLAAVSHTLDKFQKSNRSSFVSFYPAIVSDLIVGYVMAFLVAIVIVKAIKLFQFNRKMFMIVDTMAITKYNLFYFAVMFVIVMVAFGHFTTLAFGSKLYIYQSFGSSLQTLFRFVIGTSDILVLYDLSRYLGPLYFIAFIVFLKWCLVTTFVAILNFGFSDSKARTAQRKNKFELINYIMGRIKDVL